MTVTEQIVDELQTLARQGDAISADSADLPLLRAWAKSRFGGHGGLDEVHRLIADATQTLEASHREAAYILFGAHEDRFVHNLMARRARAGERLGLGESNFRKKRSDGESPYDHLTTSLAEAIIAMDDRGPAAPTASRRRIPEFVLAVSAAMILGAIGFVVLASGGDPLREADRVAPRSTMSDTESTRKDDAAGRESAPTPEAEENGRHQTGRPLANCDIPVGATFAADHPSEEATTAALSAYESEAAKFELGCPSAAIERWQALWIQPLETLDGSAWWITVEIEAPEWAFVLSETLFEGYRRILDNEGGTVAQSVAGLPREVDNSPVRPVMRTSNGSLVIGESDQVMSRWLTPESVVAWESLGGADGALGFPVTDGNYIDGVPRQEFENGYGILVDGAVDAVVMTPREIGDDTAALARRTEMILETFDLASWWIDAEGIRHWIPTEEIWACLGGADAKVGDVTPGWVVGQFEVGTTASCG
jgi:hypothetical protein